jgi:predicted outer membrane protein
MRKVATLAIALATAGMIAASMQGQDLPGQRREAAKPIISSPMGTANSADAQLAACLIVDNQGEIALGKLSQQRAKDKDVKAFGEKMVKDHTDFMQQLERFAGAGDDRSISPAGGRTKDEIAVQPATPGATDRALPGATAQPIGSQGLNFVALKQQIGQKCLELVQRDLEEKEGSQFDKCYIGGQIGEHMHVLATLEVVRNQASPELAAVLDKGIETTKSHLEHAQKIMKALDQQSTETARRDSSKRD